MLIGLSMLAIGLLGVAAIGTAARRLADVAATRTAWTVAAQAALETSVKGAAYVRTDTVRVGRHRVVVTVDTTRRSSALLEYRVTAAGIGQTGSWELLTRRIRAGP